MGDHSLYNNVTPRFRILFEFLVAHSEERRLDYESLRTNYLKRSPENKEEDLRQTLAELWEGKHILMRTEAENGKVITYYELSSEYKDPLRELERMAIAVGFMKVTPKQYEVLLE